MKPVLFTLFAVAAAFAQDQTGRIEGTVVDALSHQPVRKAGVLLNGVGARFNPGPQNGPKTAATDASGNFAFDNLPDGTYQITVTHNGYPESIGGVRKSVTVTGGAASMVTVELVPGASISGRIVDEDGDPMSNCTFELHPAGPPYRSSMENGSYRIHNITAGKYTVSVQCVDSVFQPRPLSEGPDPPPSAAYPRQFYPGTGDPKSATVLELQPGTEKSGIDFQMRPAPVTHVHGTIAPGGPDWLGLVNVQLEPLGGADGAGFPIVDLKKSEGTFELSKVFPGSYYLVLSSRNPVGQAESSDRVGAFMRVDIGDKPVEVSVQLHRAVDIPGTIEIERDNDTNPQVKPNQLSIQLTSNPFFGSAPFAQVNEDGSFTLKSVLPGEWRVRLNGPFAFAKSVWLGGVDVTNQPLDLTSGSAAPLRIVASTKMATLAGTAPAGKTVSCRRIEEGSPGQITMGALVSPTGQFRLTGVAPGKYRITLSDGFSIPTEGGQEITVREGETVNLNLKAITP